MAEIWFFKHYGEGGGRWLQVWRWLLDSEGIAIKFSGELGPVTMVTGWWFQDVFFNVGGFNVLVFNRY